MKTNPVQLTEALKALAIAVVIVLLFGAIVSMARGSTPESRARVYVAYLQAVQQPELPDSLENRPRGAAPDLFAPYREPLSPQRRAEIEDALRAVPAIENARPEPAEVMTSQQRLLLNHRGKGVIFIDITASQGCVYCVQQQQVNAQVRQQGVQVYEADTLEPRGKAIARAFNVERTPTLIAWNSNAGREIGRIEGLTTADKMLGMARGRSP